MMTRVAKTEAGLSSRYLWWLEHCLLAVGFALLLMYITAQIHASIMHGAALWSFERSKDNSPIAKQEPRYTASTGVDFRRWSDKRVASYAKALILKLNPSAVLSIRRLQLEVPVFDGTDELTLNRGAGRIAGTAQFGQRGNTGIAAHRDGFFRGLKDVRIGDEIELAMPRQKLVYIVDNIEVVRPSDTSVLRTRLQPSLTLVTCYPFYFVGAASERYIVQASFTNSVQESSEFDPTFPNMNKKEETQ